MSDQMFDGTFSAMGRFGVVEVTFRQDGPKLKGVLTGNDLKFDLVGEVAADDPGFAYGSLTAPDTEQAFEAYTDGKHLELYVIALLPDGTPDWNNVSLLEFDLAGNAPPDPAPAATTSAPPAAATTPAPPSQAAGGNPLAAPTDPLVAGDPFVGVWSDGQLRLELLPEQEGYSGWLDFQGTRYPVAATADGDRLEGSFKAGGVDYPFSVTVSAGGLDLESGGSSYQLVSVAQAQEATPQAPAAAPVAPNPASTATANEVFATGPYGQLTADAAYAFIEALKFVLSELGETQALAGIDDEQIVEALAAGFPALDPESQMSLANARQIWEQTRQSWPYADLATKQEFAYAVLTIAYGEQAASSALGMGGGQGGQGAGGGPIGMPSPDPALQEQTNNATSCWAAAGCADYDPAGGFTYETPDGY